MFNFLFGFGKNKIKETIKNGAVIIDVRTPHEYDRGKVPGSVNIPVDRMAISIERIKSIKKPIDRKSTRLNSSHIQKSRMPSSA